MANLPKSVISFAGNNTKVYEQFKDYYFHARGIDGKKLGEYSSEVSFAEKEKQMHTALLAEVTRLGGAIPEGIDLITFSTHPTIKWAMGAVVTNMIEAIIPDTIIRNIGLYTDIKNVEFGATAQFNLKPNATMSSTKFSNAIVTGKQIGRAHV